MRMSTKFLILPLMGIAAVTAIPQKTDNDKIAKPVSAVSKTGDKMLIPGGQAIGITLESDGILVLGTGGVTGKDKTIYYPAQNVLKEGDIIIEADGERLDDKESLEDAVRNSDGDLNLKVMRKKEVLDVVIEPVQCIDDGSNKIGVWVRDSTQGIGTLTFIDPINRSFGALGHGVYDVDTGKLMAVKSGNVVKSRITGVKKSEKGVPGEITGILDKSVNFGTISDNTERGVYGTIDIEDIGVFGKELMLAADASEIVKGPAKILCTFDGGTKEEYEISIEEIDLKHTDADKGLVIKINDNRLKDKTGGIIQGMSGSPIVQNGKLVGAVTHVLVNDPTRGYGIFIENMLEAAE